MPKLFEPSRNNQQGIDLGDDDEHLACPTGAKISKTVGGTTRDYVDGIEYSNGTVDFIQTEEGRAILLGGSGYSYEYILKDPPWQHPCVAERGRKRP